ncbi:MAG: hypothetical protein PQJ60_01725, partial [Spirochaetales bacterium]|nr:hypothetical protein [Spirochaetales bacterium]
SFKQKIYAEIILSDFGVLISNDAGIDFWDNYVIYDSDGNAYLPDQESDTNVVLDEADSEDEVTYEETILYTGIEVTAPTVEANLHLDKEIYFQISSQPELDFNLATTLGGQGEWAGAETENTGGFSFILDYPRFDFEASVVSQYYYSEDDITQDDEFGGSLYALYEINDDLTLEAYSSIINFYSSDNDDDFYFVTSREGSTADCLVLTGTSLTYSFFELVDFGFYGDFGYVWGGNFNRGDTDDSDDDDDVDSDDDGTDFRDFEGFLYDLRMDLPFPFDDDKGVVTFSWGIYDYSYEDDIFDESERDDDLVPLDFQLALSYTEERWQVIGALQAFNILDWENSLANYLFDDHQELGATVTGQYTFGDPSRLAFTPSLSLDYSTGRLMTEGWYWDDDDDNDGEYTEVYIDDWNDDVLGLELSLALEFPQTVITLTYTSLQLIPGQDECYSGDDYVDIDTGILTVSTVISY